MKKSARVAVVAAAFAIAMSVAYIAGAIQAPIPVRTAWIRLTADSEWERNNRIGALLEFEMTPSEVENLLGEPDRREGERLWSRWYYGGRKCIGSELVVEFMAGGLCYVHQGMGCARQLRPTRTHYTIGVPTNR